jgi:hypothetical protein
MLCSRAGADLEAIPAWIEEGRRRRARANMPPLSGGLHPGHGPGGRASGGANPAGGHTDHPAGMQSTSRPVTNPGTVRYPHYVGKWD